ncbi:MAG TPA: 50S ribosomal protein L13 [Phycisphaerales bacterium]|nr:50S ribosomal protein L13 [Phycisphaerales bacterium]
MKSYLAKNNEVERKWRVVDAEGQVLGRLAVKVAMALMGKDKPVYTPHVDTGDFVVIVNADKIVLTGNKAEQKFHQTYSRYPGGQKTYSYARMMERHPDRLVKLAVKRMLPKNTLGHNMFRKLKVYAGPEHPHTAQQPIKMEL